jgi:hypothetical protein
LKLCFPISLNAALPENPLANKHLNGKKIAFFGDPQIWYHIRGGFHIGSRINLLYNLIQGKKELKIYPTIGLQYKF